MAVPTLQLTHEYESVNPFDGTTVKTFVPTTDEQLETKIATAQTCYETWRHKSYAERAVVVNKAADLMRSQFETFAKLATLEMGKRINESRDEVNFSADFITSSTVQDHIKSMLDKTASRNRSELIARILGWEAPPNPRAS